ncbi:hypothetical protein DPMN_036483 [Dreissena polymorpha]|uniref:Uncharacterized protein n=1 Tax=Dreissena polymorpha TaxID=45954 RepID=A0A9D4RN49_DREPO|nr:hypothetical protein DPMN_036483 [Dreissena polymorpha]
MSGVVGVVDGTHIACRAPSSEHRSSRAALILGRANGAGDVRSDLCLAVGNGQARPEAEEKSRAIALKLCWNDK